MSQYKTTNMEDLGYGIFKLTLEDEHSETSWGRSVTEAVNAALVEQGHVANEEGIAASWEITVWVDTLEESA